MNDNLRFWYFMFITVTWMAALGCAFFWLKTGMIHALLLSYGLYPGAYFLGRDIGKRLSTQKRETIVLLVMLVFPALFFKGSGVTAGEFYIGVGIGDLIGFFVMKLWGKYPFPKDK